MTYRSYRRLPQHPQIGAEPGGNGLRTAIDIVKTLGLFAVVALPIGLIIDRTKASQQTRAEKAEFHRLGLDWSQRVR